MIPYNRLNYIVNLLACKQLQVDHEGNTGYVDELEERSFYLSKHTPYTRTPQAKHPTPLCVR